MCEIRMSRTGPGCYELTATGHATGSERACAAVSGLLYALAGYLENAKKRGAARVLELRMDAGDVRMEWTGRPKTGEAFELTAIGLLQLAQAEPERVRVEVYEG